MRGAEKERASAETIGRKALRIVLDLLAAVLLALLVWRFIAGDELRLGAVRIASMRTLSRPVWGLALLLVLRHLLVGPGGWVDRLTLPLARRFAAAGERFLTGFDSGQRKTLQWIPAGLLIWGWAAAASGATRALAALLSTEHLELTPWRQAAAVLSAASTEFTWGFFSAMPLAVLIAWWASRALRRPDLVHLLYCDGFLAAAPLGPWGREPRWDMAPASRLLGPGASWLLAAAISLTAVWAIAGCLRPDGAGGLRSLKRTVAAALAGLAVYFLTPLPRLLFGGPEGLLAGARSTAQPSPADAPAHILLVTIDTLRADHMGCYGYARPTSPSIDRLASMGVRFDRAYCGMPLTDPSHTSILTGWYPRGHGILRNGTSIIEPAVLTARAAPGPVPSLPELLRQAGYRTAAITSRQHLHPGDLGIRGFEFWSVPFSEELVPATDTLSRALDWLSVHGHERWFLWVHFFDPHFPYTPPEEIARLFAPDYHGGLDRGNNYTGSRYSDADVLYLTSLYDAEIAFADEAVGRLIDTVLAVGESGDPPLLVLTADHGESLGELKSDEDYVFAHGEYLVEPQIRVPLIVARPGVIPAGRTVADVVENLSVAPTIAGLAAPGRRFDAQVPGLDRWLTPAAPAPGGDAEAFVQRRFYEDPPKPFHKVEEDAIVTADWKLITNSVLGPRLRRLADDPLEKRDHSASEPGLMPRLSQALDEWKAGHPIPAEAFGAISPEKMEQLRALGYIQ